MADSNFIDYVKFCSRSGAGGAGSVHFRREKHVPKGGPDGGDGGRGGHIILRGSSQLWTLLHLKYKKHVIADPGKGGDGGRRTGADGKDVILEVPLGTVAKDAETGEKRFEITTHGQEIILTKGGRGVPNEGKSTLLSAISAARPEIGDYPFTTLVPNLGVVGYRDDKSFVMADIPGIIEGAAEGKGLGIRFLRHIERNSILLFLIPADAKDIKEQYQILLGELRKYNPELLDKKRLLAISKVDMLDDQLMKEMERELPNDLPFVFISSVSQFNLEKLKDLIWQAIHS